MKPFLRWAGGKSWLLKYINLLLPPNGFNNYYEPFLGGGAVFLHLKPKVAYLSDLNRDLINTYLVVKNYPEKLILELNKFPNTKDFYYSIRNIQFEDDIKKAAQFIYLNQTSFNGIYRVNLKGIYNVPYGYRNKGFFDPQNLNQISNLLSNVNISAGDFDDIRKNIKPKDLVFLDPPYTVTHNDNGFIKYNQKLFSLDDQIRLSELLDDINSAGAYYILTNAAHYKIREIFSNSNTIIELKRASLIGGLNAKRGKYSELIFTNVTIESDVLLNLKSNGSFS